MQTLQIRNKWQTVQPNFAVNDVVLVYDENASRSKWPVARIVEVYSDDLGRVRQALVKTATSVLKRPVTKLHRVLSANDA